MCEPSAQSQALEGGEGGSLFVERDSCILCGGEDLKVLWQDRFDSPQIATWISSYKYARNVTALVGGERFVFVRCRSCRMKFHQRILAPHLLDQLYGEWIDPAQIKARERAMIAERFERGRQLIKRLLRIRALLRPDAVRANPRLLDFGCGGGELLNVARVLGFDVIGVDASPARRDAVGRLGIDVVASLDELDERWRGAFDAVTILEVLEHVPNPRETLRSIVDFVAPGGVVLVEVPNCEQVDIPKTQDEFDLVQPLEHINAFTPATVKHLGSLAGLRSSRRVPAYVTTRPLDVARTWVGRYLRRPQTDQYFTLPEEK